MSPKATARPGVYRPELTPWVFGIHDALDDPAVREVVCMKSAQVAWTDGVLLNYLGRRIDIEPCPMIVMFAKEGDGKSFNDEKFVPMVEVTPHLADKIPITAKRDKDNRWQYKGFPGGFLKFVGSNSPGSVKSTPAPVVCVEEPDDCNTNVREQGDTITLLKERAKTFPRPKVIFGGTPAVEGASRIASAYLASDQRKFWVPCPHCGEFQVLMWEHVQWSEDPGQSHEVFRHAVPSSARYCCPHHGCLWTNAEKNAAVRKGEWRAGAAFNGAAGFYINEVYSPFPGSQLRYLVEKYLLAQHELEQGDDTKARAFRNSTEGLPYAYKTDVPEASDLQELAEDYAERSVPAGGLLLSAGVDVQHDRLAVVIRAWGRGEESWLVFWGEISGSTLNPNAGAWLDLDNLLFGDFVHATGARLRIGAASIDGSDGNRTEVVNAYVRTRRHRMPRLMTVKGASEQSNDRREIYSLPRKVDPGKQRHQLAKRGMDTYIVGTHRAKDLILETRVKQRDAGPGRLHFYRSVRPDYWEQLVSEVKVPSRMNRNRKVWTKKAGVRNEALDAEVYCLHAARSLKTNLLHEAHWAAIERQLRQRTLIDEQPTDVEDNNADNPPPTAEASDGLNVATDKPGPGEPETVQASAPVAPIAPARAPAVRRHRPPRSGGAGFKINTW